MKVTTQKLQACELVSVEGVLDSATAPALEKTLQSLLAAGRNRIVINLSGVEFMTSVGLRALLGTVLQARRQAPRGDVVLAGVRPELLTVFQRVGLTHVFTFYDDDSQAADSFLQMDR